MNIKEFIENQLATSKEFSNSREEMLNACTRCYGALMYAMERKDVTFEEVSEWWEKIREEFYFGDYGVDK